MKKGVKKRSKVAPSVKAQSAVKDDDQAPMDEIVVNIQTLRLSDEEPKHFIVKVTFVDQVILKTIVTSVGGRDHVSEETIIARGVMTYDPSDYEKMCLFADYPLVVNIQPAKIVEPILTSQLRVDCFPESPDISISSIKTAIDVSCCNIDILPLFTGQSKLCLKKRMQPMCEGSILQRKSWENLPLLTLEISAIRNEENSHHQELFKDANYFSITLLASYNMIFPYEDNHIYTAATKLPAQNENNGNLVVYNYGSRAPTRFAWNNLYPKWESLWSRGEYFTASDKKFVCDIKELLNDDNIDLTHYFSKEPSKYTTVWGSFHRTICLEDTERWLWKHLRRNFWPFEIHVYGESGRYSFMALLDLTRLLYPGENVVRLTVPLQWINSEKMLEKCGCETLLTSYDKMSSTYASTQKHSKATRDSRPTSMNTDVAIDQATGMDNENAFAIIEVKLGRALKKLSIPPQINETEIIEMLRKIELEPIKRECTGRGQLDRDWRSTVRTASNFLRKIPYYGMTEFCALNRQLSTTRTQVELSTSCWQEAAIYVNNNFVVQEYLSSDEIFEEMLMMSHACLMRIACDTLIEDTAHLNMDSTHNAARNALQMQDTSHAMVLYLKLAVEKPRDANVWRELSTCLKQIDTNWANICLNKSVILNPRHPLTLVCKACAVFEENKETAEPFFVALLALYPFWTTAWIIASAYYIDCELFYMSDQIIECEKETEASGLADALTCPRTWGRELGDWWDHTPLLSGMSPYYDAADLLLRIRAIELAEVCVAQGHTEAGDSATYFHLLALCCRLRGNIDDALCHIKLGLEKYGEVSYLRSLQAECYQKQNNIEEAMESYEKAGNCMTAYNILISMPSRDSQRSRPVLVDLVRRQPSAYSWMAFADDWVKRAGVGEGGDAGVTEEQETARSCAVACAVQALKWDRMAGRAWALLAKLVETSARRHHCNKMARLCGYSDPQSCKESKSASQQTICHRLAGVLRECRCKWCYNLKL